MSIKSVINDTASSESIINAQKPLPPTISGYSVAGKDDTALDPAGGQTVQINGTGFLPGATITFDGSAVSVVTYVNPNQLTFTSPAKSAGTYTIYVVNSDGGTAIYIPGVIYSTLPTWTTSAGSLGSYYETQNIANTVVASGDAPITYSLFSGSLPTGATLYSNGVISGTAPVDSSSTTYSFTIQASDAQLQDSTRSFSLTINTDVVTWVSPANGTTYTSAVDSAISNVTLSATDAAGYGIVYSANALPTGLSLSGNTISGTPTVIADSSTLLTATANTTSRSATRTINWSITVANDPYFKYDTLLLPGASTTFVDDASTNNFAVSIFGDTKPNSFNPYTPGYYSGYFDGTGDYLQKVSPPSYLCDWTTTNFTIEYWVNAAAFGSGVNSESNVVGNGNDAGDGCYWSFGPISTGAVRFYYYNGSQNNFTTATTLSANKWYHLAFVNNSGSLTIYIDGVSSATATKSGTPQFGSAIAFTIGKITGSAFTGYISNLRIAQSAVYTGNFTPSTSPLTAISGTQLLTCQSNRFIDNSTNNVVFTLYGDTSIKSFDPFIPNSSYSTYGSGYFDGTGDYLIYSNSSQFAFGTGSFTIEFWINAPLNNDKFILGGRSAIGTMHITTGGSASTAGVLRYNGSSTIVSSNLITDNAWHHCAIVRDGSNNITLYVDGVSVGTGTDTTNYTTTTGTWVIGANDFNYPANVGSNNLTGYLSNLRLVKGTAVYTSAFTPPTSPLTAIANTSLLTLQNNQSVNNSVFLDNSSNNFLVTRAGNTTQGSFSPYGPLFSNYFDGSGDYLQTSASASPVANQDFTLECWYYPIAKSTNYPTIYANYTTYASNALALWERHDSWPTKFVVQCGSNPAISTTTVSNNTWYHIAYSRSGSTGKLFINGVLEATVSGANTSNVPATSRIGAGDNASLALSYIYGYVSNFRIVNGTALYTSNFTPSTSPLTSVANTSLLTCADSRLIDDSPNNFTITKNGDTSVQRFSPFSPQTIPTYYSGYFDGTGDYLTLPDNTAFDFSGDFTIEAWVYLNTVTGSQGVYSSIDNSADSWVGVTLSFSGTSFLATSYISGNDTITHQNTVAIGQWYHIAICRSGSTTKSYLNGVQSTGTTSGTYSLTQSGGTVGSLYPGTAPLNGYISNLRVVKGTALYTSTFTPPTSPLTAISGTSLLTCQSATFIDNSTNNFAITVAGDSKPLAVSPFTPTATTSVPYTQLTYGGSSYFDGNGDYLSYGSSNLLSFGTGNFTVEAWIYVITSGTGFSIFNVGGASAGSYSLFVTSSTNKIQSTRYGDAGGAGTTTNSISLNTWVHVAAVRNSGTAYVYVNGVLDSGATYSMGSVTNTGASTGLIWNTNYSGAGYITDVRVVGTALYTSNFVPPVAPLTAVQNTSLLVNGTSAGIYDASMINDLETVGDAKLSTAVTKFGGSSMYFDGSGDYLYLPSNTNNALGTGDFTVECWVYATSNPADVGIYESRSDSISGTTNGFTLTAFSSSVIRIFSNGILISSSGTTYVGTWCHVAVVRSSGTWNLYINGVTQGTSTASRTLSNTDALIGGGRYGASGAVTSYFPGYIDDFRITKGYARYTSNFTPPTIPFPVF